MWTPRATGAGQYNLALDGKGGEVFTDEKSGTHPQADTAILKRPLFF